MPKYQLYGFHSQNLLSNNFQVPYMSVWSWSCQRNVQSIHSMFPRRGPVTTFPKEIFCTHILNICERIITKPSRKCFIHVNAMLGLSAQCAFHSWHIFHKGTPDNFMGKCFYIVYIVYSANHSQFVDKYKQLFFAYVTCWMTKQRFIWLPFCIGGVLRKWLVKL